MRAILLVSVLLCGCLPARTIALDINSLAHALCEKALGEPHRAALDPALERRISSMSVQEACALDDVIAPFVEGLLTVKKTAMQRLRAPVVSGANDVGTVRSACAALCKAGCTGWCPTDEARCELELPNLMASGITVDLTCMTHVLDCSTAPSCVQ
jgi:hypothetical protein